MNKHTRQIDQMALDLVAELQESHGNIYKPFYAELAAGPSFARKIDMALGNPGYDYKEMPDAIHQSQKVQALLLQEEVLDDVEDDIDEARYIGLDLRNITSVDDVDNVDLASYNAAKYNSTIIVSKDQVNVIGYLRSPGFIKYM